MKLENNKKSTSHRQHLILRDFDETRKQQENHLASTTWAQCLPEPAGSFRQRFEFRLSAFCQHLYCDQDDGDDYDYDGDVVAFYDYDAD